MLVPLLSVVCVTLACASPVGLGLCRVAAPLPQCPAKPHVPLGSTEELSVLRCGCFLGILPCVPVELVPEPAGCPELSSMGCDGLQSTCRAPSPWPSTAGLAGELGARRSQGLLRFLQSSAAAQGSRSQGAG